MESSILKYKQLDMYNDKEKQGLNKYKSKGKDKKYVFFPFIALFSFF